MRWWENEIGIISERRPRNSNYVRRYKGRGPELRERTKINANLAPLILDFGGKRRNGIRWFPRPKMRCERWSVEYLCVVCFSDMLMIHFVCVFEESWYFIDIYIFRHHQDCRIINICSFFVLNFFNFPVEFYTAVYLTFLLSYKHARCAKYSYFYSSRFPISSPPFRKTFLPSYG